MDIIIENLKNINRLDISLEEKKVNFIFGISGSGKTAISDALTESNLEEITQIGKLVENVVIKVDGRDRNLNAFQIYNQKQVDNLSVYAIEGQDAYEIIFSNSESYNEKVDEFDKLVSQLALKRNEIFNRRNLIQRLLDSQGAIKLKKKDELPKTALVNKIKELHVNEKSKEILAAAKTYGQDKFGWLKKGTLYSEYIEKKCPFCEQEIERNKYESLNEILKIDNVFFKAINEESKMYSDLDLEKPDYLDKDSLDKHSLVMKKYSLVLADLVKINNFIDLNNIEDIDPQKLTKIELSDAFIEIYPDITKIVNETNNEITKIKQHLSQLKSQMKKVISDNLNEINTNLKLLGFKYKVVQRPVKPKEKKGSFILKHKSDANELDRSKHLSTGEKNILALIFFLLKTKTKNLIIDDPASSFDENRRKIIYDLILKKANRRTIIVLSHDEVFTKFAIKSKYLDRNENIGVVKYMSNYTGQPITQDIHTSDYNTLETFAKDRIVNTTNPLLHVINSRIIFESKRNENSLSKAAYGYLSAIIHQEPETLVMEELSNVGISETDVLLHIKEVTGAALSNYMINNASPLSFIEFTNIEKIFCLREDTEVGITRDEMSSLIHLNDRLAICLNPYKFDNFSPYLYDRVALL